MTATNEITPRDWFILILLSLIWGSSFILMKKALVGMDSITLGSLRISVAGIAFLPYLYWASKKINWKEWYKYLFIGLTTTGIPSFCFAIAQTHVDSATSGILNSLTPILTLIIGVLFFNTKFIPTKLIGVVIGFMGASLLVINSKSSLGESNLWYTLLIVVATICYGINGNAVKKFFPTTPPLVVTTGAFILVSIPGIIILLTQGTLGHLIATPDKHMALFAGITLSLFCTVLANILFYDLIQKTNALFASSVTFLIPLVAIGWGWIDNEKFSIHHFVSMIAILMAMILIRRN